MRRYGVVITIARLRSTRLNERGEQIDLVVTVAHGATRIAVAGQVADVVVAIGEHRAIGQLLAAHAVEGIVGVVRFTRVVGEGQHVAIVVIGVARV